MSDSTGFHCDFHGNGISIAGSRAVIGALASRLGQLPGATAETENHNSTLYFEFHSCTSINSHCIEKPLGDGRVFYAPQVGEALYYPEDDLLYLDYGGRVRALCRPREGSCVISLLEPEVDQLWLGTHPLFTIPLIEMLKRRGKYNVHAAAFGHDGNGILLAGTTGAGKSTLTIALLRAGFDFMGDDMAFLEESGELRLLAFPENVDVTDATVSFFAELQPLAARPRQPGWQKHEVRSADFFPSSIVWQIPPRAIVFPRISQAAISELSPVSADEAFLELASNVLLTHAASTRAHLDAISRLVRSVPAYRLHTGRDFDRIPDLLRDIVQ